MGLAVAVWPKQIQFKYEVGVKLSTIYSFPGGGEELKAVSKYVRSVLRDSGLG